MLGKQKLKLLSQIAYSVIRASSNLRRSHENKTTKVIMIAKVIIVTAQGCVNYAWLNVTGSKDLCIYYHSCT